MPLLIPGDSVADGGAELGDLGCAAGKLLGLVAVRQRRGEPICGQVLPAAAKKGSGQPADQPLAMTVPSDLLRQCDLAGFIEPTVGQGTLCLSDSQDQHGRTSSWIIDDWLLMNDCQSSAIINVTAPVLRDRSS
jgi:hypothetical protein